jgi:glycosyltransferase involved in cell wall biosynthesis
VGGFLDYESFFKNVHKPIVWTIHDENPGLGGFHYSSWKAAAPDSFKKLDDEFMEIKRKAYKDAKSMTLVAISTMMADYFKNNELLKDFPVKIIHNGIDGDAFTPINKGIAREALAIEKDELVFLFAANYIHEDRKGLKELIEALEKMNLSNTTLICLGKYNNMP